MTRQVLTLVANPDADRPFSSIVSATEASLGETDISGLNRDWLEENTACDFFFTGELPAEMLDQLFPDTDYCLQPAENRRKKLLLADMDSTMITVECIDELADFAGLRAEVSGITEQAMRGELDFDEAFKARVAMLKGLKEEVLQQTFDERVTLTGGARTLIQTMKAGGAYTALVSGGFTFFTSRVRELTGFDMDDSNELLFEDGMLTGKAAEPILNSMAKLENLERLLSEKGLKREESAAIGDGANDIPMIEGAGLGIAFHAKPVAIAAADAAIRFGDLTTLLYYQGYRNTDFVS